MDAHQHPIERLTRFSERPEDLPQVTPRPIQQYYTMRDPFIFAALDSWKGVFNRSVEEQMALVRSADFRGAFKAEIKGGGMAIFRGRWDRVHVARWKTRTTAAGST